jgi:threonine dehydrogenase-like Zn-dependent dehydrogenase
MRALVLTAPLTAEVQDVPEPEAGPGQVVIDVLRVGVCGTDRDFYRGTQALLQTGQAVYPLRIGHEWMGTVARVGDGVEADWIGRRVTGDTMLGCRACDRCARGLQHVCANRFEVGVLGGWHGALAEQLLVPVTSLQPLPDSVSDTAGAMVEPGGNSARAMIEAAVSARDRVAVIGPGTLGQLGAAFALALGAEVHVLGRPGRNLELARDLGPVAAGRAPAGVWSLDEFPALDFQVVVDFTGAAEMPQRALDLVEPGGRVVCVGVAGSPSMIDTRQVLIKDVTLIGDLSGSPAAPATIESYAAGQVDPEPLVAATVPLDRAADVLAGWRPDDAGPGPKLHIDPRR